jgi:MFS family permease
VSAIGNREVRFDRDHPRYKWIVLTNTTLGMLIATVNASIVIISLPAIFRGIHLDPLAPGNVSYLLWMLMGFLLVSAVLVVTLGRLGDMYGRVKLYNLGFVVFTLSSIALSLDPLTGGKGAMWLILWRVVQAIGGAMLFANSNAIFTDAFPPNQRGTALGINQVAAIAGSFIGLVLGGVLAEWDWRAVFWVSVPIGIVGTIWSYASLHELGSRRKGRIDWWGNVTFAVGLSILLAGITYGIQPYGGHPTGWTNPWVLAGVIGGIVLLAAFCLIETKVAEPMFQIGLFKNKTFASANLAGLLASIGRGGMQFMLIIWLQGIWLPLHGYSFADTPLWAGIYLLPLTLGFLISGPVSGYLSDRLGARPFAVGGSLLVAATFLALIVLPVNFPYWLFALLIALNGIGSGLFSAPNASAVMGSVPSDQRGVAAGMRGTFFNSGSALSIGIFFSLMIIGLASKLPTTLTNGLTAQGVPHNVALQVGNLPPVGSLFAAFLGFNPLAELLGPSGVLHTLPASNAATLTGKQFFPHLISGPFHHGLVIVFAAAAIMMFIASAASLVMPKPAAAAAENDAMNAAHDASKEAETADQATGTEIAVDGILGHDVTGLLEMTEAEALPAHANGHTVSDDGSSNGGTGTDYGKRPATRGEKMR